VQRGVCSLIRTATSTSIPPFLQQPFSSDEHQFYQQSFSGNYQGPLWTSTALFLTVIRDPPQRPWQLARQIAALCMLTNTNLGKLLYGPPGGKLWTKDCYSKAQFHARERHLSVLIVDEINVQTLFLGLVCNLLQPALMNLLQDRSCSSEMHLTLHARRW